MISIRKSWWAALAASAIVGCSNAEPTGPASPAGETKAPEKPAPTTVKDLQEGDSTPGKMEENPKAPKIEAPAPSKPEENEADAAQDGKAGAVKLTDEEAAEIKKLPEADAALALKQKVCPVSGEHLGAMDMPVKVRAEGRTFFLCCKGCNKELQADPKAVVAKLNQ